MNKINVGTLAVNNKAYCCYFICSVSQLPMLVFDFEFQDKMSNAVKYF